MTISVLIGGIHCKRSLCGVAGLGQDIGAVAVEVILLLVKGGIMWIARRNANGGIFWIATRDSMHVLAVF